MSINKVCCASGQALVEFALVIPVLIVILMGIFDLGLGVYSYNVVASAAREGARFGILDPANTSGIRAQATANTNGLEPSRLQSPTVECSDNGSTFNTTCNSTRTFIRVTVIYSFQPISFFVPALTLTGKSMMAIEP